MEIGLRSVIDFQEGMMVSDLRQSTSINFINTLRENKLIEINHRGQIKLTDKGKIASKMGIDKYLRLKNVEKEFLNEEIENMKLENRGLLMIFGGMLISLVLIIGFWALQLEAL